MKFFRFICAFAFVALTCIVLGRADLPAHVHPDGMTAAACDPPVPSAELCRMWEGEQAVQAALQLTRNDKHEQALRELYRAQEANPTRLLARHLAARSEFFEFGSARDAFASLSAIWVMAGDLPWQDSLRWRLGVLGRMGTIAMLSPLAPQPKTSEAFATRGSLRAMAGRLTRAIDDFETAADLAPQDLFLAYRLGAMYYLAGHHDDALRQSDYVISKVDSSGTYYSEQVAALDDPQTSKEAKRDIGRYFRERTGLLVRARLIRLEIYSDEERWQDALLENAAIIAAQPWQPEHLLRSLSLSDEMQDEDSRSAARSAIISFHENTPEHAKPMPQNAVFVAYFGRATERAISGQAGMAYSDWEKAIALQPPSMRQTMVEVLSDNAYLDDNAEDFSQDQLVEAWVACYASGVCAEQFD